MTGYDNLTLARAKAGRTALTPAEAKLWQVLRANRFGRKFRRQQPIGPFIADFFCAEAGLVIELDGDSHVDQEAYDARRTYWLETKGYRVVRFWNGDVHSRLEDVKRTIAGLLDAPPLPACQAVSGPSPSGGEGLV